MATIRFTEADRDDQGFVAVPAPRNPEPRNLADLLPTPAPVAGQVAQQRPASSETATAIVVGLLIVIAVIAYLWTRGDARPAAPPRIPATAPAATQQRGDGIAAPSPIPAAMLPAYAAPNGDLLGAIEATRAITPTAHYTNDWVQADVAGSGVIWLKASDFPALAIVGPDLAPRPTATARPYVPPTPEPEPPCASAGVPGKMIEVCGWGDLATEAQTKWLATYGGNPGIVTTPTPYGGTK
jgi:hypothetical protein